MSKRPVSSVDIRELSSRLTDQPRALGSGRASDSDLICRKTNAHQTVNFLMKTGDTTAEAIEKLRSFINATRCSCTNSPKGIDSLIEDVTMQDIMGPKEY